MLITERFSGCTLGVSCVNGKIFLDLEGRKVGGRAGLGRDGFGMGSFVLWNVSCDGTWNVSCDGTWNVSCDVTN